MELWQWALCWLALQAIQTVQIALVGRKVTRTLVPPPPLHSLQQQAPPPLAAPAGYCRNCGSLTPAQALGADGVCLRCVARK